MEPLIRWIDDTLQKHDLAIMERREKQQAAIRAAQKILEIMNSGRYWVTEELVSIIFSEFENVPKR